MTTVRHLEKLWNSKTYERLVRELLNGRPENSLRLASELTTPLAAAALALIRLDELDQSHVPLAGKLLRTILLSQDADGGWTDPMTTALCLRALLANRGHGLSIERGFSYLANLQKPEGIWPREPIRRLPADAFASAFVLYQLGSVDRFRAAVRFANAIAWFDAHGPAQDPESRRLWDHARLRARVNPRLALQVATLWS
jgi:hypothetical protein